MWYGLREGGNTVENLFNGAPSEYWRCFLQTDIANTPLSSCLILPSVWGILEREHEVFFADGFLGKLSYQTIKKDIALFQPQLIAVHMVYQWDNHCELCQFFKEIRELCSASIVVCGFYPSFAYKDLLMTIPEVDGIVIGEPETAFQALSRGVSVDKAPSMAYRDVDGSVRQNPLVVVNEPGFPPVSPLHRRVIGSRRS